MRRRVLLVGALLPLAARAQVPSAVGNHGVSTGDVDWSVVQVNPAAFGEFIAPLGTGALALAVDGGAAAPLSSLAWRARDAVFPALALELELAALGVTVELDEFAPLSPFHTLQGFVPALLAAARFSSNASAGTAAHTFVFSYAFTCNGMPGACVGAPRPPAVPASFPAATAPRAFPGAPAVVNTTLPGVFLGAAGGDAASASCSAAAAAAAVGLSHPPPLNFTLVAENSAAGGDACPFEGWGPGDSLHDCELACAEDSNCTTINFNAHSGDCVFRICSDPAHPNITGSAAGYNVYTTTSPKGPYPLLCASVALTLQPGEQKRALLALGHHDSNGKYAAAWPSAAELFAYLADSYDDLAAQHSAFVDALPSTGDPVSDESVRWLLAPPVLLTKGVLTADFSFTSTMGYVEMCPRDGYWTTWLHSFMWPQLEADMIREFVMFQCNATIPACLGNATGLDNDGKIPTTVLPLIYRDDNVDVTGYFVLRVARYVQASGDVALLAEVYPAVRRALLFLARRNLGDGVPAALQASQWADWLDVSYMIGRKYAPHFVFVYLAAMREGAAMATRLGQTADAAAFAASLAAGLAYVNAPITTLPNGTTGAGMWNTTGGFFQDVWWDGRNTNYTLTDNVVGSFFGLVDDARTKAVFAHSSANGNEAPWGMRDFFPYLPHADDAPGVYGNGGIYGWLTCIEATTRMMRGDVAGGARIWSGMSNTMLYRADQPAQHQAYEYLDGNTGLAMGAFPFGGDGACFMVSSLGASEWGFDEAAAAWRLRLRAPALQPAAGLELLRPLGGRALAAGADAGAGTGGGATAFVRLRFASATDLLADVLDGVRAAAPGPRAPRGTGRHEWTVRRGANCLVTGGGAGGAWAVECGGAGAGRMRVLVDASAAIELGGSTGSTGSAGRA